MNASDDRGIDIVRGPILTFASTKAVFKNGFKLIILDESDAMTQDAQNALRRSILSHFQIDILKNCFSSYGEVFDEHSILFDLQLLVKDHSCPPIAMHSIPIRAVKIGPNHASH